MAFVFVASGWGRINDDGELFGKGEIVDLSPNGLLRGVRECTLKNPDPELFLKQKFDHGKKDEGFLNLPSGLYVARVEIVERFVKKEQLFKNVCYCHDLRGCSYKLQDIYDFLGSGSVSDLKSRANGGSSGFQVST